MVLFAIERSAPNFATMRYRAFVFVFLSAAAFPLQGLSQTGSPASPPSSAVAQGASANRNETPAATDYSKEAFVIESLASKYRYENDGTGSLERYARIRVQSDAGVQLFGQLRFGYNAANERPEISYVRVVKPDGSVISAGPEAIQDLAPLVQQIAPVYTDYHEKHVTVPGLRPGDTLEYQIVTVIHTPFAPGQFWMQHEFNRLSIVLKEELELNIPSGRAVKLKSKPGNDPVKAEEAGRTIYRWSNAHLVREDDNDKDAKDKAKKKKKKSDELPDVQLTTFNSWEDVGRWYAVLEKDRRVPSKEVRAEANALTKGLNSDLEKAQALYDYVSKNFRYVSLSLGLARYQPQRAEDVLRNQYGDCKDKNTLMAALLEAEGMHSSSVLINASRKIDPEIPAPSQFNHVITLLTFGNDNVWMDTTSGVAPFRLISANLRKKQALVIPLDGIPHLQDTPENPAVPDMEHTTVDGKVNDSGKLEAKVSWAIRGDGELLARSSFRMTASNQWQKLAEAINKGFGGDVTNLNVSDPGDTRQAFTVTYNVSKENYLDWQKKKTQLMLPLSFFRPLAVAEDLSTDADDSKQPSTHEDNVKLGPVSDRTYSFRLELANRFTPTPPVAIQVEHDYASYHSNYKIENHVFTAERELTIKQSELPAARADDYRSFRSSVLADAAQALTVESSSAEGASVPSQMTAEELIQSGNEARRNGNLTRAVDLLNQAVTKDPKTKRGWDSLGLAYFDSEQDDLAVNAFQKQVQVNPYDQFAYNNLGRVYLRQRKYEEAEKWFLKQIEVSPLDKYAHHNLGITYLEGHKFERAIPELERAAAILPNNADPQVRLGEAYLNTGDDRKAMAAFDRAVEISATPVIWNNIAYQLSLKKSHLDKARTYAESAISSTTAALGAVSLQSVNQQQVELTAHLARYWDTLGWVAFAEGRVEEAEKYVSAAWQLSQLTDAGDHLGQVNEKLGKKADAIRLYALSYNSRWAQSETRDRLAALTGNANVDEVIAQHKNALQALRTLKVKNPGKVQGDAAFFVMFSTNGKMANVQEVKFLRGSQELKQMDSVLRSLAYPQSSPDGNPVTLLRRGTLSCTLSSSDCTFVFDLPEDVRSVE